jgi:hypothetical protein
VKKAAGSGSQDVNQQFSQIAFPGGAMKLNRNWWIGVLVLAVSMFTFQNQAIAQLGTANVHGVVTDSSGAVVPNASVTLTNTGTNASQHAKTDNKGYYVFPQVPTGTYSVTIKASGFQKSTTTNLNLPLNASREVDASLKVGSTGTTVRVQASQVAVETSDTQLKTELTANQIEAMPLISRDVTVLQKTAPGVVESSDRFGTFASDGNQTAQNSFIYDGVDINDGPLQQAGFTPDPDSLSQFQVVLSTLNPEYARNSGAIDLEASKSGTNQFHGEGFEFYRNSFLNSVPFQLAGAHKAPPYHRNEFGGNLGGPVLKNKLFFFVSYQGRRSSTSGNTSSFTLSPQELAGTFSASDPLYGGTPGNTSFSDNPMPFAVGNCAAGTPWSACFKNGMASISPSDMNQIALNLATKYAPTPNTTIGGYPAYAFTDGETINSDQGIIHINYNPTANDSVWSSVSFESEPETLVLPFTGASVPGFGESDTFHTKVFSATWTHIFSPTLVNELRGGYYRDNQSSVNPQHPVQPSSLGFNINPQDAAGASVPYIGILNGPTLGFSTNGPQPRIDTNMEFYDDVSKVVGNHNMKFGGRFEQFRVHNPFLADNNGAFNFDASNPYSTGNSIMDYFLGIPDSYVQESGSLIDVRAAEYYAFAQDNWKVSDTLTLNYGLTWDVETPWSNLQYGGIGATCWSLSSQQSTVYPGSAPGLLYPGDKGCNQQAGVKTSWSHFAPRVGIAYSPDSGPKFLVGTPGSHQFSVRAGFGLYYNRDQEEGSLQNLSSPPFLRSSQGAADFGGSPSFTNPFQDVATGTSEANPFPYKIPAVGTNGDVPYLDINAFSKNYQQPVVYNFNLNVQRQLPGDMVLTVGYVGELARHLINVVDGDPITPAGHAACLADPACIGSDYTSNGVYKVNANQGARNQQHLVYPEHTALADITSPVDPGGNPWYLGVGEQTSEGVSSYNSLQVQLQKAPTHGLSFNISYTYSHSLDNASGLESSGFNGRGYNSYPGFSYLSYGNSDFDVRQRLSYLVIYQVPVFQFVKHNFALREALSGWTLSGYGAIESGFPVTLYEGTGSRSAWCDGFYNYYSCPDTPNTSNFHEKTYGDPRAHGLMAFDTSVFSPEPLGTFGNTKRNYFPGPGENYTDASLYKDFYLGAGTGRFVEIRMDAQNVFNHTNFLPPSGDYGTGSFGAITGVFEPTGAGGDPQPARIVQLGGKFVF